MQKCDVVRAVPSLAALPVFGVFREATYNELLADVLAMWAKGYLEAGTPGGKRLRLTPRGRATAGGGGEEG
jgi:hypothetical protein